MPEIIKLPRTALSRVEFRLFDFEYEHISAIMQVADALEIDGEIVLHFEGSEPTIHLSWKQDGDRFKVAGQSVSFFCDSAQVKMLDASHSRLFEALIGKECEAHMDEDLADSVVLCAKNAKRFLCPYGDSHWDNDVLYIGEAAPPPPPPLSKGER